MDPETHRCDTEDFQNRDACVSCFPEGSRKLLNPFLWLIKHQWLIALVTSVPLTMAATYRLVSSMPQHYVSALDWSELRFSDWRFQGARGPWLEMGIQWET